MLLTQVSRPQTFPLPQPWLSATRAPIASLHGALSTIDCVFTKCTASLTHKKMSAPCNLSTRSQLLVLGGQGTSSRIPPLQRECSLTNCLRHFIRYCRPTPISRYLFQDHGLFAVIPSQGQALEKRRRKILKPVPKPPCTKTGREEGGAQFDGRDTVLEERLARHGLRSQDRHKIRIPETNTTELECLIWPLTYT